MTMTNPEVLDLIESFALLTWVDQQTHAGYLDYGLRGIRHLLAMTIEVRVWDTIPDLIYHRWLYVIAALGYLIQQQ
jgi:hypothetical protein